MNSCMGAGLSMSLFITVADRTLSEPMFSSLEELSGPGLSETSPARTNNRDKRKLVRRGEDRLSDAK